MLGEIGEIGLKIFLFEESSIEFMLFAFFNEVEGDSYLSFRSADLFRGVLTVYPTNTF